MIDFQHSIISSLFECIDKVSADLVSNTYHNLAQQLAPMFYIFSSIYVGLLFVNAMRGVLSYHDMLLSSLKLVVLLTAALNYNYFCVFIYDIVTNEPLYIFKTITISGQKIQATTINEALDNYFNLGRAYTNKIFLMGGWNPSFWIFGIIFFVAVFIENCVAAGLIILSKIAATILLALSPLFIFCAIFESTRDIFSAYLRQLITYSLIPVLACIIFMMTFSVASLLITFMNSYPKLSFTAAAPFLIMTFIQIYLLTHVYAKAAALASGFSLKGLTGAVLHTTHHVSHIAGWLKGNTQNKGTGQPSPYIQQKNGGEHVNRNRVNPSTYKRYKKINKDD